MKRLCGVNPPVITIFDEHHKVDIEASKRQADFLISKGVDGLVFKNNVIENVMESGSVVFEKCKNVTIENNEYEVR